MKTVIQTAPPQILDDNDEANDFSWIDETPTPPLTVRDVEFLIEIMNSDREPNEAMKRANESRKRLIKPFEW